MGGFGAITSLGLLGADERSLDHGGRTDQMLPAKPPRVHANVAKTEGL